MNKIRAGLVAVIGIVIGVLTVRRVRKRRTNPREEAKTAAEAALQETGEAASHAAVAAGHARVATEKAVEYAQEELDAVADEDVEETALPEAVGRLRRARKD